MARQLRRANHFRPFILVIIIVFLIGLFSFALDSTAQARLIAYPELLPRQANQTAGSHCRNVHQIKDQCAFIQDNCDDEDGGIFSYLGLYFCRLPSAKPLGVAIIALWLALLFSTIGIAASEFFCVNISTISNILGMSESFAGVTFLAFGNGSPDVFSTFAAVNSHSGSMAIGELIGAAGFITAVVAGSMAIVRPFKVARKSFVRDVSFFIVAISFSMVFVANGELDVWECAVMVGFYLFYVITVVCWHWWLGRRRRKREREAAARSHYVLSQGEEVEYYHDVDDDMGPLSRNTVSDEDFDNLERADYFGTGEDLNEDEEEEERDKLLGELNSNMRVTRPMDIERRGVFNPIRPSLVGALEFRAQLASLQASGSNQNIPLALRRYSDAQFLSQDHIKAVSASDPEVDRSGLADDRESIEGTTAVPSKDPDEFDIAPHRGRAISANGVANLRFDPSVLQKNARPKLGRVSPSPPPEHIRSPHDNDPQPELGSADVSTRGRASPRFSVSSPPEDEREAAATVGVNHQNLDSSRLLAPPTGLEPLHSPGRQRSVSSPKLDDRRPNRSRSSSHRSFRLVLPHPSSPLITPKRSPIPGTHETYLTDDGLALPSPSSLGPEATLDQHGKSSRSFKWWPYARLPPPSVVSRTLFPTLHGWRKKSFWAKLVGVAAAPSFFLLTITLPVVEAEKEADEKDTIVTRKSPPASIAPYRDSVEPTLIDVSDGQQAVPQSSTQTNDARTERDTDRLASPDEWNRWLVCIQCFTSPLFMVVIFWINSGAEPKALVRPVLFSLLGSLIALLFVLVFTKPSRAPRGHFLLCFVGFAVSITWISTIAGEVVAVLKTIGVIFNMSDAILGLTIFAVGNSLGDLVADITVARLGYPVMALSACFGGPLLNILLGVGLSGLYVMINGAERRKHKHPEDPIWFKPYRIQISTTLMISAIALLTTLAGLLIFVPLNGWRMDRKIGVCLIGIWCISTIVNVIVEVRGIATNVP